MRRHEDRRYDYLAIAGICIFIGLLLLALVVE